jgi:hypothetical protein
MAAAKHSAAKFLSDVVERVMWHLAIHPVEANNMVATILHD